MVYGLRETAESIGSRIGKACTSAANGGASADTLPLNLTNLGVRNSRRRCSPSGPRVTFTAFSQTAAPVLYYLIVEDLLALPEERVLGHHPLQLARWHTAA
jgi:hypothetical protein